ncbi:phenylacetate--CoA ligase, partial [bacterium]|nr:phenylacetate--CoA ligase [bacterium]
MMAWAPYEVKQGLKWVYGCLPVPMRYGRSFLQKCRLAEEREKWTAAALAAYQNEQLCCLISHAYNHVPYYRALFDRLGIDPDAIRSVEDLQRIPPLTKDDLRNHFSDLTAVNVKKKDRILLSTSGTSGRPLRFYSERRHEAYLDGDAYRWRHLRWG